MAGKITSYMPYQVNNLYAINVRRMINENGYETLPIKRVLTHPTLFFKCRIFNFNWFEKAGSKKEFYAKAALLCFLKLFGKKIIYTLHNKQPHNAGKNDYSLLLMKRMCRAADTIIGLCPDTLDIVRLLDPKSTDKLTIIPHPNYIANYEKADVADLRAQYGFEPGDLVFLFLGFISPYKNVEMLIQTVRKAGNPRIKLLVAGSPCSAEYQRSLETLAEGCENIKLDFRYVPDEEIAQYYKTSDVVVMPYLKKSSLNSGAAYLSFSLKRTIICPDIGTIRAMQDRSFVYDYTYESDDEHARKLEAAMLAVCRDYAEDPDILRKKGEAAYEYVKTYHSDAAVKALYGEVYNELY